MHKTKVFFIMILAVAAASCFPAGLAADAAAGSPCISRTLKMGVASYYSYECAKLPMANGRPFDPEKRTCASWFYDFGTILSVRSLDTGRTTRVIVTDRGPNKRLVKVGRVIDLSKRAFEDICDLEKGLTRVEVTVVSPR
jgi:rare lipoprotein A